MWILELRVWLFGEPRNLPSRRELLGLPLYETRTGLLWLRMLARDLVGDWWYGEIVSRPIPLGVDGLSIRRPSLVNRFDFYFFITTRSDSESFVGDFCHRSVVDALARISFSPFRRRSTTHWRLSLVYNILMISYLSKTLCILDIYISNFSYPPPTWAIICSPLYYKSIRFTPTKYRLPFTHSMGIVIFIDLIIFASSLSTFDSSLG